MQPYVAIVVALAGLVRRLVALACMFGAFQSTADDIGPRFETALRAAIQGIELPGAAIHRAIQAACWNSDKTAVAVAIHRRSASLAYTFLRQPDGSFRTIDISAVESGNFGKLGRSRKEYTRFETVPVRWLRRDDGCLQVVMRTRAWIGRQRYTVSEALVIRPDGTPVWR